MPSFDHHGLAPDGFSLATSGPQYGPDTRIRPTHYDITLDLDLEGRSAAAEVTIQLRSISSARTLVLDAVGLDIETVESPRPHTWRADGQKITVTFEELLLATEDSEVTIRYRIEDPISGLHFILPDEAYPDRPRLAATDHETERARYWLPCLDHPSVRTTFALHLTVAEDLTVVAGGVCEKEEPAGSGRKISHWRLDYPCPSYLYCFAAGELVTYEDESVDGLTIAYHAPAGTDPKDLARSFDRTPAMVRWLQEHVGAKLPFPKYHQIAVPDIGGAMENISLVTWDQQFVLDETLAKEWSHLVDIINIHEMAHSFFGDAIVIRHFDHAWLKESWATYTEVAWLEDERGRDEADYELWLERKAYIGETKDYVRPIVTRQYDSSWMMFDRHLYPGGSWRLHMLRRMLGDEVFWAAVRDYVDRYQGEVVETDDFRRVLENHSGRDLVRFFDQWIYGRGYPTLKGSFRHDAEKGWATLKLEQTQADEKRGIGVFDFDLEVTLQDERGTQSGVLHFEGAHGSLVLPCHGKPRQLRVDPSFSVLFELELDPGEDLLAETLQNAPDIAGRILAGQALIESGTPTAWKRVREAIAKEPFFGVRVQLAQALADSRRGPAIPILRECLEREKEPRALEAIAGACGEVCDHDLAETLRLFLDRDDLPYRARARALESLGAHRDDRDLPRLVEASCDEGYFGIVRAGALGGLGKHRSRKAAEELRSRLAYGSERWECRPVAVAAFASAAKWQDEVFRDDAKGRLRDLLRDPTERVRRAAIDGLVTLKCQEAAGDIRACEKTFAAQWTPWVQRRLKKLSESGDKGEVESLRSSLEKLEQRIASLEGERRSEPGDR